MAQDSSPGNVKEIILTVQKLRETLESLQQSQSSQKTSQGSANEKLDNAKVDPHHTTMNSPTREEIDAKLETIEVKIEGRMSRIEDKLVAISNTITAQKNAVWQASAVVVATIVATAALVLTSFDSGRETTKVAADAKEQITKVNEQTANTLAEIKKIAAELKSSQASKP